MVCAWFCAAAHRRNLPASPMSGVAHAAHNTGSGCWCDKKSTRIHTNTAIIQREGVHVQKQQTECSTQAHRAAAHCQRSMRHHHRCRVQLQLNSTSAQCHTTLHTTSRTSTMHTRRSDAHSRPSPRLRSSYPQRIDQAVHTQSVSGVRKVQCS